MTLGILNGTKDEFKYVVPKALSVKTNGKMCSVLKSFQCYLSKIYLKKSKPHAPGFCSFFEKELFHRIGGYREDLAFCEDHDLMLRMQKVVKDRKAVLIRQKVANSTRRFKREGYMRGLKTYLIPTFYYYLFRDLPGKKFEFKAANHLA